MELVLREPDRQLYSKLYVSRNDIEFARYCARVLLKKGWHVQPWERRGSIYQQQSVFTLSLVVAYGRVFTHSKGWPRLPVEFMAAYDESEAALHQQLIEWRHTTYAHSDSTKYSVQPWRRMHSSFTTDILSAPVLRISASDTKLFLDMTSKLLRAISDRMRSLLDASKVEA